jgi:hypothetical protein
MLHLTNSGLSQVQKYILKLKNLQFLLNSPKLVKCGIIPLDTPCGSSWIFCVFVHHDSFVWNSTPYEPTTQILNIG